MGRPFGALRVPLVVALLLLGGGAGARAVAEGERDGGGKAKSSPATRLEGIVDGLTRDVFVGAGLTGRRQLFRVPGSALTVAGLRGKRSTFVSGRSDLGGEAAMKARRVQPIGSNTKVVTAVLVMQLVEKGRLDLTETVPSIAARYRNDGGRLAALVGEYEDRLRGVELRELLNHTSGLFDCLDTPAFFEAFGRNPRAKWTLSELAAFGLAQPAVFPPGAPGQWNYSNTDYMLLGMVLEAVTGEPVRRQMNRLFHQAGMDRTRYAPSVRELRSPARSGRLVSGYMSVPVRPSFLGQAFKKEPIEKDLVGKSPAVKIVSSNPSESGPTVGVSRASRKETKRVRKRRKFTYRDVTNAFSLSIGQTAGGIVSNTRDLATFYRALFDAKLVKPETLREMKTTVPTGENSKGVETRWGLGFGEQRIAPDVLWNGSPRFTVWMHLGDLFGYASAAYYVEEEKLVVANTVNLFPLPVGDLGMLRDVLRAELEGG
jgi:CubicO group peptidase (beta-lactamase class C family)